MKKNSFLLLEVLIAFSLLTLCLIPLILHPLKAYRLETEHIWKVEKERIADWTFSEIEEKLLKKQIPWESLPKLKEKSPSFSLPSIEVTLGPFAKKRFPRKFFFTTSAEKERIRGNPIKLLRIYIEIEEEIFEFRLLVTRQS